MLSLFSSLSLFLNRVEQFLKTQRIPFCFSLKNVIYCYMNLMFFVFFRIKKKL